MASDERWRRDPEIGPSDPKADLDAEIGFHLDELARRLVATGMTEAAARAEAVRRFGALEPIRAVTARIDSRVARRRSVLDLLHDWSSDVRYAVRQLVRHPGFTALTASTIALGVGAAGAILSAGYAIMIRPLPYPDEHQLIAVSSRSDSRSMRGINISYLDYAAWRDRNTTLSQLGTWTWWPLSFTDGVGDAERVEGAQVSPEIFSIIGARPLLGRLFTPDDTVAGAPDVIVLGHGLWSSRFAGDSATIGRTIRVDGRPTIVIGVMPPRFAFPDGEAAWVPLRTGPGDETHGNRWRAGAIGRMKPGVTLAAAAADLDRVSTQLEQEFPNDNLDWRADVASLRDDLMGRLRRPLVVFIAAVTCLLLIASANVANLQLTRGIGRQREMAVRSAIGAGRGRLYRQLIIESLTVSLIAGTIGLVIAGMGIRLLAMTFPDGVPFFLDLSLDPAAVGITLSVTVLTGVIAGLAPALRTTRFELVGALRDGGGRTDTTGHGGLRNALVVAEIALAVILLINGTLLIKSFASLDRTDLGFDRRGLVTAQISLPQAIYREPTQVLDFYQRLLGRVKAAPGVQSVGTAEGAPMSGWDVKYYMTIEGAPPRDPANQLDVHSQRVSPSYFETLGTAIVRGRGFTESDVDSLSPVAVINEALAAEFGGEDPIGRRIRRGRSNVPDPNPRWMIVVGVVKSFRHVRLPDQTPPALYLPFAVRPPNNQTLVVRTNSTDPLAVVPAVRAVVREIDPTIPLYGTTTIERTLARVLWQQRLQGQVTAAFALLALLLAAVGIYAVVSYSVTQRTRELGVRAAVGASAHHLTRLVVKEGGRLAFTGAAIGLAGAWVFARLLTSLLHGVTANDPATYLAVPAVLLAVALLASWIPARRAGRADPLLAMRD